MTSLATSSSQGSVKADADVRLLRGGLLVGLAASWIVKPDGPDRPLWFAGRELPVICLFRRLTGSRCPGCGMTRGMVYMFRLKIGKATAANPLAPLAFGLLLLMATGVGRKDCVPRGPTS